MSVFVDTSAFLAVLDADGQFHQQARVIWERLLSGAADLLCTNHVLLETVALAQRRLGLEAVRTLEEDVLPLIRVIWLAESHHRAAMAALLTAGRRDLSLVDCASFLVMRASGVKTAFAFDDDFRRQGFDLPAG
ncbi:MAG: PIN domain-containing protein [Armatimonadota bacterium]|nr:PIN domain-containing protein [Armatimonadota bacterium]